MYARIDEKNPERKQTLREHCRAVADCCGNTLRPVSLYSLGYLAGLLHDFGKARACYQDYLFESDPKKKKALKGKINHSAAGAQWLAKRYGNRKDKDSTLTLELLCLAITGHHAGLSDCLTPMGEDALRNRVFPERSDIELSECERNFFGEAIADTAEIDRLFDKACTEAAELISRAFTEALNLMTFRPEGMSEAASKKNRTVDGRIYTFLYSQLGLAARFLLSAIVDADRYNALFFEQNGNVEEPPRAIR